MSFSHIITLMLIRQIPCWFLQKAIKLAQCFHINCALSSIYFHSSAIIPPLLKYQKRLLFKRSTACLTQNFRNWK